MNGAQFECQRCTACCRWPGEVRVTDEEILRLAIHLGVTADEFIQCYMRLSPDRRGLALQEQLGGACVFLNGQDCRVQPVKPQQCRDFPGWKQACQARSNANT